MRVAVDVDNVLCNTTVEIINFINERLPDVELKMSDIISYWIEDALPSQYDWIVPLAFEQSSVWKKVKLIDGAAEILEKLYNSGVEVYFATATTAENFKKKIGFLERSFPFFPKGYVKEHAISIKHKQILDVDYLIDDYADNLTGQRRYRSICFDYPWNRELKDNGDTIRRVYNWNMIYDIIMEDLNGKV